MKESKTHSLRLAYLTTTYPTVSHTFIRRELREIENRGHSILRLAIRKSNSEIVDPLDKEENLKTTHCLSQPLWKHAKSFLSVLFGRPLYFLKTLFVVFSMSFLSERGLLKHLAYFVEACTLLGILRNYSVQHVHVHFGTNSATVARLIKHLGGPSYSFTVHGPAEFDASIGFDLSGKIADAEFVVAISDYCSAQLRRWSTIDNWNKIHVVHCTVGDEFFEATVPNIPVNKTFVCIGRLVPQKGQLVLLKAFSKLIEAGYDTQLVFVGDGELREVIEQKISAYNLTSRVTITGYVSEDLVRTHILNSRALVLPSFAEGLPVVIMEAFALGRPVVSTYVAGIPELVRPGENGWLVPAGNVEQLAEKMTEVLKTPAERLDEMADHGRNLTYKNYRTVTECVRLENLFFHYII